MLKKEPTCKVETPFLSFALYIWSPSASVQRFQHLEHEEPQDRNSNAQEHYQKLYDCLHTQTLNSLILPCESLSSDLALLEQVRKFEKHRGEIPWNLRLRTKPMAEETTEYTMYLSWSLLKEPIVSGSGYLSTSPGLA